MKNLANFKVAVKTREYLIQAIFQMLFSNQEAAEIINQFKNEHQDKKVDFAMFTKTKFCMLKFIYYQLERSGGQVCGELTGLDVELQEIKIIVGCLFLHSDFDTRA